jgi:hypothetical protein
MGIQTRNVIRTSCTGRRRYLVCLRRADQGRVPVVGELAVGEYEPPSSVTLDIVGPLEQPALLAAMLDLHLDGGSHPRGADGRHWLGLPPADRRRSLLCAPAATRRLRRRSLARRRRRRRSSRASSSFKSQMTDPRPTPRTTLPRPGCCYRHCRY